MTYILSAAGQRAALLAGRTASETVTETVEVELDALAQYLDQLAIASDGLLSWKSGRHQTYGPAITFDRPPADLGDALTMHDAAVVAYDAASTAKEAAETERRAQAEAERKRERDATVAHDRVEVETILAAIEVADPLAEIPYYTAGHDNQIAQRNWDKDGARRVYTADSDAFVRFLRIEAAHTEAVTAKAEADRAAKQVAREAKIAEHGGLWWRADGGMCDFLGYDIWTDGQGKRWVGIFTGARGIDRFLDSPRGENTWPVDSLVPGDCIQAAGYSTKSSGTRKNESEFFGLVIRNDETGLVVRACDSRSAALRAAKKL